AGLACAVSAAERGHEVALFDAASEIGGQLIFRPPPFSRSGTVSCSPSA
ncbi:NAD(P)-binding protein, partial [Streptomyces afghaniensis]